MTTPTLKDTLARLQALGDPKVRAWNAKNGAGENQFGVKHGDIRKLAAKIKVNHGLACELWETGNTDARQLAVLLFDPGQLSSKDMERLVKSLAARGVSARPELDWTAEWLISYVVKKHPQKEALRAKWMTAKDPWLARAAWSLTSDRIAGDPDGLDPEALLDRIEAELKKAPPPAQWTMNMALATIGIRMPKLRRRAVAIGEKLGVYRDWPVSKGCTSPFAPAWIEAMAKRGGSR